MAIVESQTLVDAIQFDGTAGKGMWDFSKYRNLPRTTAIQIDGMAYNEDNPMMGEPPIITACAFIAFKIGNLDTTRMVVARDDAMTGDLLNPVTGNAAKVFRGYRLPREAGDNGEFWNLFFLTRDKTLTGSATITYYLKPSELGT